MTNRAEELSDRQLVAQPLEGRVPPSQGLSLGGACCWPGHPTPSAHLPCLRGESARGSPGSQEGAPEPKSGCPGGQGCAKAARLSPAPFPRRSIPFFFSGPQVAPPAGVLAVGDPDGRETPSSCPSPAASLSSGRLQPVPRCRAQGRARPARPSEAGGLRSPRPFWDLLAGC